MSDSQELNDYHLYDEVLEKFNTNERKKEHRISQRKSRKTIENEDKKEKSDKTEKTEKSDKTDKTKTPQTKPVKHPNQLCLHENTISEKGCSICIDCGIEMEQKILHNKEWRYYGQSDTKHVTDPNRVHARKKDERHIYGDVENLGISEKIICIANRLYINSTKGSIYRGKTRRALVFACVFYAHKILKKPISYEKLLAIFGLDSKAALQGIKMISIKAKGMIQIAYITPANLIAEVMDKFSAKESHKNEVISLYDEIKNRSSKLNRARPQSVAAGIVYYWICLTKRGLTIEEFLAKINLSQMTVLKIAKEIATIRKTPDVV